MNLATSRDHALRIAVWSVIATEAVMFAVLIAMRGAPPAGPNVAASAIAAAATVALFAAGAAVASSMRRMRDGQVMATARLLVLATILGFVALAAELLGARLLGAADTHALIVVGLHAAHVAAAISLATWVLALVRAGRIHRRHCTVLDLVATYWYFVAGVWVFVWPLFCAPRP